MAATVGYQHTLYNTFAEQVNTYNVYPCGSDKVKHAVTGRCTTLSTFLQANKLASGADLSE